MPRAEVNDLSDEQLAFRLQEAARDIRDGHVTRCTGEAELREFFAKLRNASE